ncbi:MAG: hypothetical protein WBL63_03405, partial [Candidatus Acidiferrum sp.]
MSAEPVQNPKPRHFMPFEFFDHTMEETYANCPKYITRREVRVSGPLDGSKGAAEEHGKALNEVQK